MCSIEKQNIYFYSIFDVFQKCRVYHSVVGLKISTIHCSVISVEAVLFSPAIFHALSSFLVRHFHVLHFQSTRHNIITLPPIQSFTSFL